MGLFKKKDGSPTLFSKITKSVVGVAGLAANFVPGGGIVSKALDKAKALLPGVSNAVNNTINKISNNTGGLVNLHVLKPGATETAQEYAARVAKGAGGGVAGALEQVKTGATGAFGSSPLEEGFAKQFLKKYGLYAAGAAVAVMGYFIIKRK